MRYFFEMYPTVQNRQQAVDDLGKLENHQQVVDDSDMDVIFHIPWGHHVQILGKCKNNPDKALFYVKKTLENCWSRQSESKYCDLLKFFLICENM